MERMGKRKGAYRVWVGKYEEKRLFGRPRLRLEGNMKMDICMGWGGMDLINLALDRDRLRALMNALMNLRVP